MRNLEEVKKGEKYYTAQEALKKTMEAGISCTLPTLLSWVEKHELGFQPGGNNSKWYIKIVEFDKFLEGEKTK